MNRRTFLHLSGLGLTALSAPDAQAAVKSVGLQLYTLRDDIGKLGIEKVLAEVARLGYKKVENFGYGAGKQFGKTPAEYVRILKANGLTAVSGHYLTGRSKAMKTDGLTKNWQQAVNDAATMGQQYMVIAYLPDDERKPADYQQLYGLLNKGGEMTRKAGIQLCYHNHDFEFTGRINGEKPYDLLLKNTDPALLKMELDLYWAIKAGELPGAYFKKYPGRFPLWHVKDMANTPGKEFAEVGTGTVNFGAIFKDAKTAGLKHYFVEQDESKKRPPLEAIKISIGNIQKAAWG